MINKFIIYTDIFSVSIFTTLFALEAKGFLKELTNPNISIEESPKIEYKKLKLYRNIPDNYYNKVCTFMNNLEILCPHYSLSILNKNLKTLKIIEMEFEKKGFYYETANFNWPQNIIKLDKEVGLSAIYHELFHCSNAVEKEGSLYVGFKQVNKSRNTIIGTALNEGYTSIMTSRYFNALKTYGLENYVSSLIEDIIGQERMESYYANADLYHLVEDLSKFSNKESVIQFLLDFDYLAFHYLKESGKIEYLKNAFVLKRMAIFLLKVWLKKLEFFYQNKNISLKEYQELLLYFKGKLNSDVTISCESYRRRYSFLNSLEENIICNFNELSEIKTLKKRIKTSFVSIRDCN